MLRQKGYPVERISSLMSSREEHHREGAGLKTKLFRLESVEQSDGDWMGLVLCFAARVASYISSPKEIRQIAGALVAMPVRENDFI